MPRNRKAEGAAIHNAADDSGHSDSALPSVASAFGQTPADNQSSHAVALAPTIAEIRYWHRQRVFAMEQRKRADLALGAFLRTQLGWSRSLPGADAAKIAKQAADLVAFGEKVAKGKSTGIGDTLFGQWGTIILASIHGRAHWDAIEATATKEMERLASSLPAWESFGEGVKGFGPRSLAVIIGEAGDIGSYATVAKLWKRMGLAVMNGVRQGGLRKTASADEWIAHGYSARRRSYMYVIGDVLVKNKGAYREVYLARKEYEREQAKVRGLTVAPSAKIPAKRKAEFISDGHIHKRSQRYMEKRLLRDLWRAWRRTSVDVPTNDRVSAATSSAQAEHSATLLAPSSRALPSASHSAQAEPSTIHRSQTTVHASKASTRQTRDRVTPIATSSGKKQRTRVEVKSRPGLSAARSAKDRPSTVVVKPSASIPAKVGKRQTSKRATPVALLSAATDSVR
jgi:hypothetical protein